MRFWWTPGVLPAHALGVGVVALERPHPVHLPHPPLPGRRAARGRTSAVDQRSPPASLGEPPAARGGASTRRCPGRIASVTQTLSTKCPISVRDLQQVAGRRRRAARRPRDGARAGSCARSRRATSRCRSACGSASAAGTSAAAAISPFGAVDLGPVHVAADVARHRLLRPLPVLERLREELELARGRREADDALRRRSRRRPPRRPCVTSLRRRRRPRRPRGPAPASGLLVGAVDVVLDEERAVLAHVRERRQALLLRRPPAGRARCARRSSGRTPRCAASRRAGTATRSTCGCRARRRDRSATTARSRTRPPPTPARARPPRAPAR